MTIEQRGMGDGGTKEEVEKFQEESVGGTIVENLSKYQNDHQQCHNMTTGQWRDRRQRCQR